MEKEKIPQYMLDHFESDMKAFASIDKNFVKLEEQLKQNGQHFSFFSKNTLELKNEIKDMLTAQNEVNAKQYNEMKPLIDNFEETTKVINYMKKKGNIMGNVILYIAGFIITVWGAWSIIRDLFIK